MRKLPKKTLSHIKTGAVVGILKWKSTDKDGYYQEKIHVLAAKYGLEWMDECERKSNNRISGLGIYWNGGKENFIK